MDQALALFFDTKQLYERNNRSDGCKSLRFEEIKFPLVLLIAFSDILLGAFLIATLTSSESCSHWQSNTIAVAQLRPLSKEGLSSRRTIPKETLLASLRSPLNPGFSASADSYFLGDIVVSTVQNPESKVLNITFNGDGTAWHYGWKSSKWVQDTTHVLDVVVLEDTGGADLNIIGSFESSDFGITSTKKKRNDLKQEQIKGEVALRGSSKKKKKSTERSPSSANKIKRERSYSPDAPGPTDSAAIAPSSSLAARGASSDGREFKRKRTKVDARPQISPRQASLVAGTTTPMATPRAVRKDNSIGTALPAAASSSGTRKAGGSAVERTASSASILNLISEALCQFPPKKPDDRTETKTPTGRAKKMLQL